MNKLLVRLLKKRGLTPDFLDPKYSNTTDSFALYDMEKAVNRIKQAIKNQEKIIIYGDYDVDGVTASTVMEETLTLAGVKPENISIMLPDRFADGYGMSPKLIKKAEKKGISLVITVDCGSGNREIIDELNTLKIDTIVTDHHETPEILPDAVAIINPKRKDHPTEELKNLAGVGVAFKLAQALVKQNLIKNGQEKWLLDLVLLGTICDNMTLTNENRTLSYFGLKVLAKTRRLGLKELMRKARVKNLTSDSIGFQIGPRLNAAGRLESAEISLNLLRTKSPTEAASLANKLEDLNQKRKIEQQSATKEIKTRGIKEGPIIIETGHWHEGILGIVAGRLLEEYHKPSFVLTELENGIYKGSARSFGDFNLAEALSHVKDTIIKGGGHAGAAGVSIEQKNIYAFREKINDYYNSLKLKNQDRYFKVNADLELEDFSDLTLDFLDDLKSLEPFGAGNEEPIFKLKNVQIENVARMGAEQNHLRLDLKDKNNKHLKLVAFYAPEEWLNLDPADPMLKIEPLITLTENEWGGVKSVEARLIDLNVV